MSEETTIIEKNKFQILWEKYGVWLVIGLVSIWIIYQIFKPVPKPPEITSSETYQKIDERLERMEQEEKTEDSLQAIERKNFYDSVAGLDWKLKTIIIEREKNTDNYIDNADIREKFRYLDSAIYKK